MRNRPLNLVEQGNLLTSIRRDIVRIRLQLQRLMEHLDLPSVTDDEVDAVLEDDPDFDGRSGTTGYELPPLRDNEGGQG